MVLARLPRCCIPFSAVTVTALAIAIGALPGFVRLTRASALAELPKDYVTASRVAGAGTLRQMFVNVLPNCMAPLIVNASLGFSTALLAAAGLGFLGLGVQAPTPDLGSMVAEGARYLPDQWWLSVFPGIAILIAVFGFNLIGDGLRDALDPRIRGR